MSAREFCWWKWLIQKEMSDQWLSHDRKDWQLAKIAHTVYVLTATVEGMFSGKMDLKNEFNDFLADEMAKKSGKVPVRQTRRQRRLTQKQRKRERERKIAEATAAAEAKWFAAVGFDPSKK